MSTSETTIEAIFEGVEFFKPAEFKRPDKLDRLSLRMLDSMRREETKFHPGIEMVILADFSESGHSSGSMHGLGKAFDLFMRNRKSGLLIPPKKQFLIALQYQWSAVGFYTWWARPGIHVDTRPRTLIGPSSRRIIWRSGSPGVYQYPSTDFWKDWEE